MLRLSNTLSPPCPRNLYYRCLIRVDGSINLFESTTRERFAKPRAELSHSQSSTITRDIFAFEDENNLYRPMADISTEIATI